MIDYTYHGKTPPAKAKVFSEERERC